MAGVKCRCCDDRGEVIGADGEPRPCSRCRWEDFEKYMTARRPKPEAQEVEADG